MGLYKQKSTFTTTNSKNEQVIAYEKKHFESFNENILDLGPIEKKSTALNALSIIFDLEGFTTFCKQIDPHLAVPEYMSEFLTWIFSEIKTELTNETLEDGYETWSDLPFFCKYLGDGLLFLWDTDNMSDIEIQNVVVSMYEICKKYTDEFYPNISKSIISPPTKLRCGIARGTIYSVGNGNDFVGPCINMSARLQKLHSLTFCFSRRGISINEMGPQYKDKFIIKKVNIRGIGEEELVGLIENEFNKLPLTEKAFFKDV